MRHFNLPTYVYNKVAGDMHVRAINQVCSADYVPTPGQPVSGSNW